MHMKILVIPQIKCRGIAAPWSYKLNLHKNPYSDYHKVNNGTNIPAIKIAIITKVLRGILSENELKTTLWAATAIIVTIWY